MLAWCAAHHGIVVESYSPLCPLVHKPGGPLDMLLSATARSHGVTAAQVLLKWNLQKGGSVVTTSGKRDRIEEAVMVTAPGFELSAAEMAALDREGQVLRHRAYWADEFGDCYEHMAASVGVGPTALMMV